MTDTQISIHPRIRKIKNYYAEMGWVRETVFLNNLIVEIEGTEKARQMSALLKKPDTCRTRDFFEQFKHIATDKKGKYDSLYMENAFQAFDSANYQS